jgi:hypothetical protein
MRKLFFLLVFLSASFALAAKTSWLAVDATVGAQFPLETEGFGSHLDFELHAWYPVDQMVFLGAGWGIQQFNDLRLYPLTAALMMRLPVGSVLMPFLNGEIGHTITRNEWLWKVGLGGDLRLGDASSLLLVAGYQRFFDEVPAMMQSNIFVRAGLLLEF